MRKAWLCALLWAPAALGFDPRYQWLTVDTPHFEIHFHQGEYRFAAKVARIAEEAHARLSPSVPACGPEQEEEHDRQADGARPEERPEDQRARPAAHALQQPDKNRQREVTQSIRQGGPPVEGRVARLGEDFA